MVLSEAAERWDLSTGTVFGYICDGKINNLKTDGNIIVLPDIPKPYIVKKNTKMDAKNLYKTILKACQRGEYIDVFLLNDFNISPSDFKFCIEELEKEGILGRNDNYVDSYSNLGYTLTLKGLQVADEVIKKKRRIEKVFKDLNLNLSFNFGCVNI